MKSDTPRTDEAWANARPADYGGMSDMAHIARTLERELNAALRWKEEDPRMLREQIRIADSAFNHLKQEVDGLKETLEQLEKMESQGWRHIP